MAAIIQTIVSYFGALFAWIGRIFEWLGGIFVDLMEFILDIPLVILRGFLDGVIYLLSQIPVPAFMTTYSMQNMFSALPGEVVWFVDFFGIDAGLAIIGAGVVFRLTRKAFTLGQW